MNAYSIQDMKGIEAELDAIQNDRQVQLARLDANWPAHALKRKQLMIDQKYATAYAYWNEKLEAAKALVYLSETAIDTNLPKEGEVPIQCKEESPLTPTMFMDMGAQAQLTSH